jgi:hypothetical protein
MSRRDFIALLGGSAAASPLAAHMDEEAAGLASVARRARSDEWTWTALVRRPSAHGHPCRDFCFSAHCCFGSRRA